MDAGTWRGVFTIVMLLLFVAICFWAFSSKRKTEFDAAARLPLEPDSENLPDASSGEKQRSNV